jgi:hypothetical protein
MSRIVELYERSCLVIAHFTLGWSVIIQQFQLTSSMGLLLARIFMHRLSLVSYRQNYY